MIFLSAFTSTVVLLVLTVCNVECSLNLNFDGSSSALFLDVGHLNHSKEFLLNSQSNVRFFAVLEPNQPVSVKSSFGPISVRETIYPITIQEALLSSRAENQNKLNVYPSNEHPLTEENAPFSILPANNAELNAYLVSTTIYRNSPQLRILFQSTTDTKSTTSQQQNTENGPISVDHFEHLNHHESKIDNVNTSNNSEHHLCAIAVVKFNSIETKDQKLEKLIATCALNKDGICISDITIPADWWPAVTLDAATANGDQQKSNKQQNAKPGSAEVFYTAAYSDKCGELINHHLQKPSVASSKNNKGSIDAMFNLNLQHSNLYLEKVGKITLKQFEGQYETLTNDDIIRILIPQKSVHSKNRVHIPVCYRYHANYPLFAFALRVRVKPGMRILSVKSHKTSQPTINLQSNSGRTTSKRKQNRLLNEYNKLNTAQNNWEISVESNSKQTQTTITAFLKLNNKDQIVNEEKQIKNEDGEDNDEDDDLDDDLEEFDEDLMNLMPSTCNEVFTILMEVDEKATEFSDAGRIVWQVLYSTDLENNNQEGKKTHHLLKRDFDRESSKLTCKLDIQKDEIESLIALTPNRYLLNTAVLTGKQNMRSLKIYAVSTSGKFDDVTLQTTCSSTDETVLKVSPSCTVLYLDGSETRSSINATILIHYGVYTGTASFQVWMPKLPLELDVSDDQLSVVHSWAIPHLKQSSNNNHGSTSTGRYGHRIRKFLSPHSHHSSNLHHINSNNKHHNHHKHENKLSNSQPSANTAAIECRSRYQQAYIEAYAKFSIIDENSGREWSFINRKYSFRVTDLIIPHLHLSDNRLAIIRSNTIEGLNPGTVELKILSPITGKQLASKNIRITTDQETITELKVNLLTGLQMQIKPEHSVLDLVSFSHSINSHLANPKVSVWSVRTSGNNALTTLYQEGLLDIEIKFSDGKVISLSDVTDSDYHLKFNSGNSEMIAYAPGLAASLPRIIALKNGLNIKLDVELHATTQCVKKNSLPLKQQTVFLNVNMNEKSKQQHNETKSTENKPGISVEHLDSADNNLHHDGSNNLQNDGHDESQLMLPQAQKQQQFHSLYNSQLSVSQRNKFVSKTIDPPNESRSSWNPKNGVEILVYSVLCIFGIMMFSFTIGCFAYAMKQKNNPNLPEFATVTTVKPNDEDSGNDFMNSNTTKFSKMLNDWSWLQQAQNKLSRSQEEDENQITYDANGNPIITNRVNIRSNPFDVETENESDNKNFENKNRQSIISYPGSEISIQITANPIVNALENVTNVIKRNIDDLNKKDKLQETNEEVSTPEPNLQEIKNMLNYCKSISPASLNQATNKLNNNGKINRQPPPIPPRRQQNNHGATFVRGKKTPGQQLPVHIPGIACRSLNASNSNNSNSSTDSSLTNSINNSLNGSPINLSSKQNSPTLSPSLSSTDSGIQNELTIEELPIQDEKHLITNPFLTTPEQIINLQNQPSRQEAIIENVIPLTKPRSFTRKPPSYFESSKSTDKEQLTNNEQVYENTTGPPIPKHQLNEEPSNQTRQRTRIIPPKSLFEDMNYNEIVNYFESMEESTA